jgi:hypothetical protein
MNEDRPGVLDTLFAKLTSRKLLVFALATLFLGFGRLDADSWVTVSVAYVAVEGFIDAAVRLRGKK